MSLSGEDPPSSQSQTQTLPILAPRDIPGLALISPTAVPSQESNPEAPLRRARLSHRSRAGCWTCRGRKVKCDEQHPRCGPCTRLNKDCDWSHRWSFNNVTSDTQQKHSQVTTAGNVVWDATARSTPSGSESPIKADDLPPFQILTNDEDRERLAGSTVPGTYAVVVTPESFEALPEYAAHVTAPIERRSSTSFRHTRGNSIPHRHSSRMDPNIVFLNRFEDGSGAPMATVPHTSTSPLRRASLPIALHDVSSISPLVQRSSTLPAVPMVINRDTELITCFRQHTVYRIIPRVFDLEEPNFMQVSIRNVFESEAARFPPLYHAICALSALNLFYLRQASFDDAAEHYHSAVQAGDDDLWSSGSLLRHFILLLYDISITFNPETDETSMWAVHLGALQRIINERARILTTEPYAYLIWLICNLDLQASLLGNGDCSFFCGIVDSGQTPHITQQIAQHLSSSSVPTDVLAVLELNQAIVIQAARIANMAHKMRVAFESRLDSPSALLSQFQPQIRRLQDGLSEAWTSFCPAAFEPVNAQTGRGLSPRARAIFEAALTLFHAVVIYTRTSMFPGQRLVSTHESLIADTEFRVDMILSVAETRLVEQTLDQRSIIFPIFMAGCATKQPDCKIRAMDMLRAFAGSGIGRNTSTTRELLSAVCEEQSERLGEGRQLEEVDWLQVSIQRGLRISNCGL